MRMVQPGFTLMSHLQLLCQREKPRIDNVPEVFLQYEVKIIHDHVLWYLFSYLNVPECDAAAAGTMPVRHHRALISPGELVHVQQ